MDIHVITEGATEREVGKVLYERLLLSNSATPKPPAWTQSRRGSRDGYEQVISGIRGQEGVLETLRTETAERQRILLLFDQEDASSTEERCRKIEADLRWLDSQRFWETFNFTSIAGWSNLFKHRSDRLHIVLHIADARIDGLPGADFDGYLLRLLQGTAKQEIAERLLSADARLLASRLLQKGEAEFGALMRSNGHPWTHSKSWLYAYITAFQFRQSHVWFARDVVRGAPEDELRRVFASLIIAWERLINYGDSA